MLAQKVGAAVQVSHPDTTMSRGKKDPSLYLLEVRIPFLEPPSKFPFLWPRLGHVDILKPLARAKTNYLE